MENKKNNLEIIYHFLIIAIVIMAITEYSYFKDVVEFIDSGSAIFHYNTNFNFNYSFSRIIILLSASFYAGIILLLLEVFLERFNIARGMLDKNKGKLFVFIIIYLFLFYFSIQGSNFIFSDVMIVEIFGRLMNNFLLIGALFYSFIIALSLLLFNHLWFKRKTVRLAISLLIILILSTARAVNVSAEYLFDSYIYFLVIFLIPFFLFKITSKTKKILVILIVSFFTLIICSLLLLNSQIFFNSDFNKYCKKQSAFNYKCDIQQDVSLNVMKVIEDSCEQKGQGFSLYKTSKGYDCIAYEAYE